MEKIVDAKCKNGDPYQVYQIEVLEDNFSYLLCQNGLCLSIDPGDATVIEKVIDEKELTLDGILITHFHNDHVAGVEELKKDKKAKVLGPSHKELPFVDQCVEDEDEISIGPFSMQVFHAPGHTMDHVIYYFADFDVAFCGDVIFIGGVGKMFEGNEHHYFHSLEKIKKLPKETLILTGHDYIERNLSFIQHVSPKFNVDAYKNRTFHSLKEELKLNPFLQVKSAKEFLDLYQKREEFRRQKTT